MLRPFRLALQEGRMILPDFREVLRKIRVSPCVLCRRPENTAGRAPCRLGGLHPVFLVLLPRSAAGVDLMFVSCSYVLSLPQIAGRILEEARYDHENNDSNGKRRND